MEKSKVSNVTSKDSTFKSEATAQISPEYEGTNPDDLIFPEWSDSELNAEKWERSKEKTINEDHKDKQNVFFTKFTSKNIIINLVPVSGLFFKVGAWCEFPEDYFTPTTFTLS